MNDDIREAVRRYEKSSLQPAFWDFDGPTMEFMTWLCKRRRRFTQHQHYQCEAKKAELIRIADDILADEKYTTSERAKQIVELCFKTLEGIYAKEYRNEEPNETGGKVTITERDGGILFSGSSPDDAA